MSVKILEPKSAVMDCFAKNGIRITSGTTGMPLVTGDLNKPN